MLTHVFVAVASLHLALPLGEGVKCYHCYDSFTKTPLLGTLRDGDHNQNFVRCDKNQNNWNSWDCPAQWPVCVYVSGKVQDHYEVLRTCAVRDFCASYTPPSGVKLDTCRECNTTLCNDYPKLPDPPAGPGPLFTFNININLNLRKYPYVTVGP